MTSADAQKTLFLISPWDDTAPLLSHVLEKAGYRIICASNPEDAISRIATFTPENKPDSIIVDLEQGLPDRSRLPESVKSDGKFDSLLAPKGALGQPAYPGLVLSRILHDDPTLGKVPLLGLYHSDDREELEPLLQEAGITHVMSKSTLRIHADAPEMVKELTEAPTVPHSSIDAGSATPSAAERSHGAFLA